APGQTRRVGPLGLRGLRGGFPSGTAGRATLAGRVAVPAGGPWSVISRRSRCGCRSRRAGRCPHSPPFPPVERSPAARGRPDSRLAAHSLHVGHVSEGCAGSPSEGATPMKPRTFIFCTFTTRTVAGRMSEAVARRVADRCFAGDQRQNTTFRDAEALIFE